MNAEQKAALERAEKAAERTDRAAKAAGFVRTGKAAYPEPDHGKFGADGVTREAWHRNFAPNLEAYVRDLVLIENREMEDEIHGVNPAFDPELAEMRRNLAHLKDVIARHGFSPKK